MERTFEYVAMPPILPRDKAYHKWSEKEAKSYYFWYIQYKDARIHNMAEMLNFQADYTSGSLVDLWQKIIDTFSAYEKGLYEESVFDSLIRCAGIYLAETLHRNNPSIVWSCYIGGVKKEHKNRPVLLGFYQGDPPIPAYYEPESHIYELSRSLYRHNAKADDLIALYRFWERLNPCGLCHKGDGVRGTGCQGDD